MFTCALDPRRRLSLGLGALLALWAGVAGAQSVKYAGVHPRSAKPAGGLCTIKGVHLHALPPTSEALFRRHEGVYVFVGDPVPFGFDDQTYRFYGHHPLMMSELGDEVSYCYLNGPHWHASEPPDDAPFVERDEVFYYSGDFPQAYHRERPRLEAVNGLYLSFSYERPVIVVAPPPEYRGPVIQLQVNLPIPVGVQVRPLPRPVFVIESDDGARPRKFKHKKLKAKKFKSRDEDD